MPYSPKLFAASNDSQSFARGLFFRGDHFLVGTGDCIDGLRLAAVSLEKLIPLGDQPVHAALAVGLGLLFEGGDEPLQAGPCLVRNPDYLAVGSFGLLLEAIKRGVGSADGFEDRRFLGFEDYAFCLVCHFKLP